MADVQKPLIATEELRWWLGAESNRRFNSTNSVTASKFSENLFCLVFMRISDFMKKPKKPR